MLFTTSALGGDWEHHLWYIWYQELAIRANHAPSLFLNTSYSVFYPQYAFYGGTIYALTGALAFALDGSPIGAYVLTYVLGLAVAYGGWYWAGRISGLGRWMAHVPALLFVTSAYYLTMIYGLGDWPEFLAISMLPAMAAAGLGIVRAGRLRLGSTTALVGSSLVFFGSHNITILWASTLFVITCLAVIVCVPDARQTLRKAHVTRLSAVVIAAALVSAWYLLPVVAFGSHTRIGSDPQVTDGLIREAMPLVSFAHLFSLSRASTVSRFPGDVLVLPTVTIAWLLASIALVLWRFRKARLARLLVCLTALTAAIVVLMTREDLLLALPRPYRLVQFSYRLDGFVVAGVTATVMMALAVIRSSPGRLRLWTWTIIPVLAASVVGGVQQVDARLSEPFNRDVALSSQGELYAEVFDDYAYAPLPFISEKGLPVLHIAPGEIHQNRVTLFVRARPGELAATNIEGGPNLLHITGASIVGADQRAQLVLAIGARSHDPVDRRTPNSYERISISQASSVPVVLGRLLTYAALAGLLAGFVVMLLRGLRDGRRRRQ
jgi:hypothetical protein